MSIEIKQLSFHYENTGEANTLEDISLSIKTGEWLGIMGHTGCGKTTLIQLLAGFLQPTQGQILVEGQDINDRSYDKNALRRQVGIVFQYPEYQLFETTVEKEVAFGLKYSGLKREQVRQQVREALEKMGFCFETICNQAPMALSGGEKRRVAIAGMLVRKPRILIFDEPIAGLDAEARRSFLHRIAELQKEGLTIIMVSHDADSLCEYADRIAVLQKGRLVTVAPPTEVFWDGELTKQWSIGEGGVRRIAGMLEQRGFPLTGKQVKYEALLQEVIRVVKQR